MYDGINQPIENQIVTVYHYGPNGQIIREEIVNPIVSAIRHQGNQDNVVMHRREFDGRGREIHRIALDPNDGMRYAEYDAYRHEIEANRNRPIINNQSRENESLIINYDRRGAQLIQEDPFVAPRENRVNWQNHFRWNGVFQAPDETVVTDDYRPEMELIS